MSKKYSLMIFLLALGVLSISIQALAESYTIKTSSDKFRGTYLVNQSNFTLYYFQNDSTANGASTCYDDCALLYTPFYVPDLTMPDNLRPTILPWKPELTAKSRPLSKAGLFTIMQEIKLLEISREPEEPGTLSILIISPK